MVSHVNFKENEKNSKTEMVRMARMTKSVSLRPMRLQGFKIWLR